MARDADLEQLWRDRVKRHAQSGMTLTEFAKREGFPLHQFTWWRKELKLRDAGTPRPRTKSSGKRESRAKSTKSRFVPLQITAEPANGSIEIILDRPPRIAVSPGFDPELLARLLDVLEKRPC